MVDVIFYDEETGEITGIGQMASTELEHLTRPYLIVEAADCLLAETHKVVDGQLVEKV